MSKGGDICGPMSFYWVRGYLRYQVPSGGGFVQRGVGMSRGGYD